ncbi:EF-hand domain-containing protein [Pseudocolwellia sp. HL-MZ7]|uniref:EF-hand domain-containing protein n=1 Tax=Pseudocolwellia sp. HL-MZ7 TaxID=3400627 RepID=UPI003CF2953C
MSKLTYSQSLILLVVTFISLNVYSTSMTEKGALTFTEYDLNGDGLISEEEFIKGDKGHMSKMRKNHVAMHSTEPASLEIDTNKDGILSEDEMAHGKKIEMQKHRAMIILGQGMKKKVPTFTDYDLDGDDIIFEQEFNDGQSKIRSNKNKECEQMKNGKDAPYFSEIDTNNDEEISQNEFITHQLYQRQLNNR